MSAVKTMTPSQWAKTGHKVDETQVLIAANSRYEDAQGRRVHIVPTLDEPVLVTSRKKPVALYVPDPLGVTTDLLAQYGCTPTLPLWLRPPLILPSSKAPWELEPGREHLLACGCWSTTVPKRAATSKAARRDWELENIEEHPRSGQFLAPNLKDLEDTSNDDMRTEVNVRLWDDARGPSHARQRGLMAAIAATKLAGYSIEKYAPFLPLDRSKLTTFTESDAPTGDAPMYWHGYEEALWCSILDDPDIDHFGLDVEESVEWDTTKNLFLEADNLLALKRLRRGYTSKVKLTYIDPPYNTGNKFVYNDSFKSMPNTGSPFTGIRWGQGTWWECMHTEWINANQLKRPSPLLPVTDDMLEPAPVAFETHGETHHVREVYAYEEDEGIES